LPNQRAQEGDENSDDSETHVFLHAIFIGVLVAVVWVRTSWGLNILHFIVLLSSTLLPVFSSNLPGLVLFSTRPAKRATATATLA
jgi:hypothetical protein